MRVKLGIFPHSVHIQEFREAEAYSEPKYIYYFGKTLHLRCLAVFSIPLGTEL